MDKARIIHKLPAQFIGTGEVKGFTFKRVFENEKGYVYGVIQNEKVHYEAFYKKVTPVCIDFENRIYSETEYKESYPSSKHFGSIAWTANSMDEAINRLT